MNMIKKNLIAVSVAASIFAAGAEAATVNNPSTAVPAVYGKNIVNETVRTVITPVATTVVLGAGEALSVDDSVTFTLTGGATFAAIASGDLSVAPNVGGATFALVSGGAGQNFATYRVTNSATDTASTLTLAATATLNGATVANGGAIDVSVQMSGFVGGVATSLFGSPLVSLNTNLVPMMTANTNTLPTDQIAGVFDVAFGFTQLLASTGGSFLNSTIGTINTADNAAATANQTTAGVPTAVPTPGNTLLTIHGPMTGVVSILAGTANGANADGTAAVPAIAGGFKIDVANNVAYATTTAAGNHTVQFVFDGTVAHEVSTYTADVTRTADAAGYSATTIATGLPMAAFTRNGSSFTSNSVGPLNRLSITDRSGGLGVNGADGAIAISAFDSAGNSVSCAGLSVPNLPNNGTVVVQGSDITNACTGVKRVEGVVNSTSILVTNVKTTADGATATPALSVSGGTAAN
ncbi:MAG: hypothetical protein K9K86_00470 [Pseudomonadales bacterium]|nr:hypothetical protein [Pseudomonadales bacterium]